MLKIICMCLYGFLRVVDLQINKNFIFRLWVFRKIVELPLLPLANLSAQNNSKIIQNL